VVKLDDGNGCLRFHFPDNTVHHCRVLARKPVGDLYRARHGLFAGAFKNDGQLVLVPAINHIARPHQRYQAIAQRFKDLVGA